MIAKGRGKVILLGEHAVVYGHPALAGALELGVRARAASAGRFRLRLADWGLDTDADPGGAPARALCAVAEALGGGEAFSVEAEADLPPRAGLGSSAALSVAVARAILLASGRDATDDDLVERAAQAGERVFHGNPSGVDVALATRGGIGIFRRTTGLVSVDVPPFPLAVGLSGEPRDTAARVADVARRRAIDANGTDAYLAELGELADKGHEALLEGEPEKLGPLFDHAHTLLRELELSSPTLDRLCRLARDAGAAGAKLTGAGGGGAVIAVGEEDRVVSVWRDAGFQAFVAEVGG